MPIDGVARDGSIIKRFGYNRFFAAIFIIASINASVGYMAWEAQSVEITPLTYDGAPPHIVFIADPHVRESNLDHINEVITEINALEPNVVLIGGDFVYGEEPDLSLQEVWSGIDAPVYAVLGNHDYKAGIDAFSGLSKAAAMSSISLSNDEYDVTSLQDASTDTAFAADLEGVLEEQGVVVLHNEIVELEIEGEQLVIVGVDDGWAGLANPPELTPTDAFTIYMIHEPDCRADWDADLVLAGHTHGGQFNSPVIQLLNDHGIIALNGLFEKETGEAPMYITRGIGTSNLEIELRFFATPEIVLINPPSP